MTLNKLNVRFKNQFQKCSSLLIVFFISDSPGIVSGYTVKPRLCWEPYPSRRVVEDERREKRYLSQLNFDLYTRDNL